MHGLQVDDVRRELAIHLPQDYTSPGIPLQHILNMVANRCTVGPPAPMFVQPLPDHHPGHVLRGVPQAIDGHQQPWSWTSHLLCGVCASADVPGSNSTVALSVSWHTGTFSSAPNRKEKKSLNQRLVWCPPPHPPTSYLMLLSSKQLCWSHRPQVTAGTLISQKQPLSSCVLSCLKWQTLMMMMMMMMRPRFAAVAVSVLHSRPQQISSR